MKILKQFINPYEAKKLLKGNLSNRTLNHNRVTKYACDIKKGLWVEDTGELIKISRNGRIIDGQHRLEAIIRAGVGIFLHVAYDVQDDVFQVIDSGKPRSAGDVFKIAGVKNYNHLAAIIQLYNNIYKNESTSASVTIENRLSAKELLYLYKENNKYWDDIVKRSINYRLAFQGVLSISEIGSLMALFDNYGDVESDRFMFQLCKGVDVKNNTIILLRNKLISDKLNTQHKMTASIRRALIIKTWNCFIQNKEPKILRFKPEIEDYPKAIFS
jgi:hypothetical protein